MYSVQDRPHGSNRAMGKTNVHGIEIMLLGKHDERQYVIASNKTKSKYQF